MLSQLELEQKYGISPKTCARVIAACREIPTKVEFGRYLYDVSKVTHYFKAAAYHPSNLRDFDLFPFLPPFTMYLIYLRLIGHSSDQTYEILEEQGFLSSNRKARPLLSQSDADRIWKTFYNCLPKSITEAINKKKEPKGKVWPALLELTGLDRIFNRPIIPDYLLDQRHRRVKIEGLISSPATAAQTVELCRVAYGLDTNIEDIETYAALFYNRDFMSREDTEIYFDKLSARESRLKKDAEQLPIEKFCGIHRIPIAGGNVAAAQEVIHIITDEIFNQGGEDMESMKARRGSMVLFHRYLDRMQVLGVDDSTQGQQLFRAVKYPIFMNTEDIIDVPATVEANNIRSSDEDSKAG